MVGLFSLIPSVINLLTSSDKKDSTKRLVEDIANTLGTEAKKEEVLKHLENNPNDIYKLKEIELKAKKLIYEDKNSARDMNIKVQASDSWLVKNTASILGLSVVGLCFVLFYLVLFDKIQLSEANVGMIIGGAIGFVSQVLSFYFGSSEKKEDIKVA